MLLVTETVPGTIKEGTKKKCKYQEAGITGAILQAGYHRSGAKDNAFAFGLTVASKGLFSLQEMSFTSLS